MTSTDPDSIPATPVYTITLSASGGATIDGEHLDDVPGRTSRQARRDALAEIKIKAAFHGRTVRATAKEPDGLTYYLTVSPDGTVGTLDQPHPTPTPPRIPEPVQKPPAPRSAAAETAADFTLRAPEQPATLAAGWAAPLPPEYADLWEQLVQREQAGGLGDAVVMADRIERALGQEYGLLHPYTVNVMTVRAWITMRGALALSLDDEGYLPEAAELLVETAERRRQAGAQPERDTVQIIRNAHVLWSRVGDDDPETARELAERLVVLLDGDERRVRDVVRWVERSAARGAV
ncbi:hypothetical protein [Streptomyces sp. NPDC051546]|uniref:hypothetical protein n=1 Tax=Streptomyces sp. NPDC051546 TaxID=3365655 RepID=UPI003795D397